MTEHFENELTKAMKDYQSALDEEWDKSYWNAHAETLARDIMDSWETRH